jgi:hypothetical protein
MKTIAELIAPIRERLAAATPGPWFLASENKIRAKIPGWDAYSDVCKVDSTDTAIGIATKSLPDESNRELIIHSPTDLSRLCAAIEILEAELKIITTAHERDDEHPTAIQSNFSRLRASRLGAETALSAAAKAMGAE